jgi:hypothetical protein
MYKPLCLIAIMAVAGCAGSSAPTNTTTAPAGDPAYTLNVPNMT